MKLNKNNAAVLSQLLNGDCKAVEINEKLSNTSQRSVQRSLVALSQGKLVNRRGVNNPSYSLNYGQAWAIFAFLNYQAFFGFKKPNKHCLIRF